MSVTYLDKRRIKQSFANAAGRYDNLASLQRQIGYDLLAKHPLQPKAGRILDLGCGTGFIGQHLSLDFAEQSLYALDMAMSMLQICREKNTEKSAYYICADAERLPFADQVFQQIYSNLALQWCHDLSAVFNDSRRMLCRSGQLVFATFGAETLRELKQAWAWVDDFAHVNHFYSVEQISEFLQAAGLAVTAIDKVVYQRPYSSVLDLMHELKGVGAHNVAIAKNQQVTSRRQIQKMISHYPIDNSEGFITASYEVIFVRAIVNI